MRIKSLTFSSLIITLLLAACAPVTSGVINSIQISPIPPTAAPSATPNTAPSATPLPIPATPTPTTGPIAVDLTPAQRAAIQTLSQKYNIPADQIKVADTQAKTWTNGCLDVVIPGVMCTNATVEGFRIMLTANGKQYDYHTNQDGTSAISAAQLQATLRLAVSAPDHGVQLVDPSIPLGPTYDPAFSGFLPAGAATGGAAYVLDFSNNSKAVMVDGSGPHDLSFVDNPNYGLALWRGGPNAQPRLAWGTQPIDPDKTSKLEISGLDGSGLQTLVSLDTGGNPPVQLVAEAWSADGQTLYYSKEPVGIGGYILFAGASSLYKVNIASKQVTELIPFNLTNGSSICLDAISGDYQFTADHCGLQSITIRDLATGATTSIQPPAEVTDFHVLGGARFSPDGKRVAFALAKGDPSAEQGWVAVSDGTSGGSKLILTGKAGVYYSVNGWLDDKTLLITSNSLDCNPTCTNQLWTVGIDGSNPTKIADGTLLTVVDNQ